MMGMGTRADFYVGRGESAKWLGSIAMDGYPDGGNPEPLLDITDEDGFVAQSERIIAECGYGTTPDQGWPWPWASSHTTDWAYMFEDGGVWVSRFGHGWVKWSDYDVEADHAGKSAEVPDMSDRQDVTMGPRSGVIVLQSAAPEKTWLGRDGLPIMPREVD